MNSKIHPNPFRYLHEFYHSPILAQILPFSGTRPNSTLFGYLPGFNLSRTLFRYSHGFYPLPVFTQNLPFSRTHPDCLSILSRILPFSSTRPNSTFLGTRLHPFSVLAWILPLSCTRMDATLLWYSPGYYLSLYSLGPFFDTRTDSTLFRYSLLCKQRGGWQSKENFFSSQVSDMEKKKYSPSIDFIATAVSTRDGFQNFSRLKIQYSFNFDFIIYK